MNEKEKRYKKIEKRLEKMKKEFASIRSELLELGSNEVILEGEVQDFEHDVNKYIDRMYDNLYEY